METEKKVYGLSDTLLSDAKHGWEMVKEFVVAKEEHIHGPRYATTSFHVSQCRWRKSPTCSYAGGVEVLKFLTSAIFA